MVPFFRTWQFQQLNCANSVKSTTTTMYQMSSIALDGSFSSLSVLHCRLPVLAEQLSLSAEQATLLFTPHSRCRCRSRSRSNNALPARWAASIWLLEHVSWCLLRSDMRENDLLQVVHEYRFTSECVCRCARRFDRSAKARLQNSHLNGFSPVCVLI